MALVCAALAGCASGPAFLSGAASVAWTGSTADSTGAMPVWKPYLLPGKRATHYEFVQADGRPCVKASSTASASMLRTHLRLPADALGMLQFSWKVPALIQGADMAQRESDDAPARIVLAFDGDRSRLSARDAMLSDLTQTLTGEQMPYATLMYVWGNHRPAESLIAHPRSARVKVLVVESGPARLGQWLSYERDVRVDFERAFGEAPGNLVGVAIMTDSDNTASAAHAWYGPVRFGAARTAAAAPLPAAGAPLVD